MAGLLDFKRSDDDLLGKSIKAADKLSDGARATPDPLTSELLKASPKDFSAVNQVLEHYELYLTAEEAGLDFEQRKELLLRGLEQTRNQLRSRGGWSICLAVVAAVAVFVGAAGWVAYFRSGLSSPILLWLACGVVLIGLALLVPSTRLGGNEPDGVRLIWVIVAVAAALLPAVATGWVLYSNRNDIGAIVSSIIVMLAGITTAIALLVRTLQTPATALARILQTHLLLLPTPPTPTSAATTPLPLSSDNPPDNLSAADSAGEEAPGMAQTGVAPASEVTKNEVPPGPTGLTEWMSLRIGGEADRQRSKARAYQVAFFTLGGLSAALAAAAAIVTGAGVGQWNDVAPWVAFAAAGVSSVYTIMNPGLRWEQARTSHLALSALTREVIVRKRTQPGAIDADFLNYLVEQYESIIGTPARSKFGITVPSSATSEQRGM